MTPPSPVTPAARRKAKNGSGSGAPAASDHPRSVRRGASPRAPRRVSGPTGGRLAGSSAATTATPTARPAAPARRTSATRRRTRSPAPAFSLPRIALPALPGGLSLPLPLPHRRRRRGSRRPAQPLGVRLLAGVRGLPDHRLLDRMVRGRAWIPALGIMLAGIVFMQVEVLKLGASIGRNLQRSQALASRNELLRASVASLSDEVRIERLAAGMGMVMPGPTQVHFVPAGSAAAAARAAGSVAAPNAAAFIATLQANAQAAAAATATPAPAPTGTQSSSGG